MLRKSMIALAAVGALSTFALSATEASAGGFGFGFGPGFGKGGIHITLGGGYYGHGLGLYNPYPAHNCFKVWKYGKLKLVCAY